LPADREPADRSRRAGPAPGHPRRLQRDLRGDRQARADAAAHQGPEGVGGALERRGFLHGMLGITVAARNSDSLASRVSERLKRCDAVMGVAAKSLASGEAVLVDADRRFPTASAIKTAVMVEVFHQIAEGRFDRDKEV